MPLRRSAVALVAVLACGASTAQQLYRWVDADGRVHYEDRPPASGAAGAAQRQKLPAPAAAASRNPLPVRGGAGAPAPVPSTATTQPAPALAGETEPDLPPRGSPEDCRRWRIEYANSQACYGRFRNAMGGIKPEAFAICGDEVLDPGVECGPAR